MRDLTFKVPEDQLAPLLADQYIRRKYNRKDRLREKHDYVERITPEVAQGRLSVVDIGPGPGEYLEWCRHYGNTILGVDSPEENAMGAEYEKLSRLCHRYQGIPAEYFGLDGFIESKLTGFDLINLQGSLEMAMEPCLIGTDFHKHHLVQTMTLDLIKGESYLRRVFDAFASKLNANGRVVLYCNMVKNQEEYANLIEKCSAALRLETSDRKKTLWTFRKSSSSPT